MIVAVALVVLVAVIWFGMVRAPRGVQRVEAPPEPYRAPADEYHGYPWAPEPPVLVQRVEHVHRWEQDAPRLDEMTPEARALIERGGS